MLLLGSTVKEASEAVGVARQTGSRWLKRYNEEGYDGLIPKFDGGRPGKLSKEQKEELKNILIDENSNYTLKEVMFLIEEKFGVKFSYKRVWSLVRKELNINYSKPFSTTHKKPENRREDLKKN